MALNLSLAKVDFSQGKAEGNTNYYTVSTRPRLWNLPRTAYMHPGMRGYLCWKCYGKMISIQLVQLCRISSDLVTSLQLLILEQSSYSIPTVHSLVLNSYLLAPQTSLNLRRSIAITSCGSNLNRWGQGFSVKTLLSTKITSRFIILIRRYVHCRPFSHILHYFFISFESNIKTNLLRLYALLQDLNSDSHHFLPELVFRVYCDFVQLFYQCFKRFLLIVGPA